MARYFLPEVVSPTQRRLYGKPVGSGLRAWDYQVSSILYKDLGQRVPRQFLLMLEYFGSGLLIPLAFLLWAVPLGIVGAYFKAFCLNLLLGFFTDLAFVGALKGLVRRPRPNYNDAGDFILVVNVDRYSFPSGHASRAVFIAVLSSVWRLGPWWVRWLVWWAALATAMSRVLMGRHYFTDVVAGVVVGILNGLVVTKGTFGVGGSWISVGGSKRLFGRLVSSAVKLR
ncbi:hypothetical protein BSKO_08000 [Bryopsis sp. KO-2023]|nr:hypothetical protein BSKO_08000 [Bryopsis sp. KO-2023]